MTSREDRARFLDSIRTKITAHNSERRQLVKQLSALIADAQQLLTELERQKTAADARGGRSAATTAGSERDQGRSSKGAARRRPRFSAAAREKIRQAQLRRWAKVRAAKGRVTATK